jgi:outer membrane protein assembly factor BamB
VRWSERLGGGFYASPVAADGKIYCVSREGECVVLEAGDAFKVLSRNPLGEGSHTTPCIDGGRLYLRTFSRLLCVGSAP